MSVNIKFKDKHVDLDFSEDDIEKQTFGFISKKNIRGALENLDRKAHKIEEARELAYQKLGNIQQNLDDPKVQFNRGKLIEERRELEADLSAIENLDSKIGSMLHKIRVIEENRPAISSSSVNQLPSGKHTKMIKKQPTGNEIWYCDNPRCQGGDKPIRIPKGSVNCPICGTKLKYIGKEDK